MAVKKAPKAGTGVTLWQDQMREAAKKQAATETITGSFRAVSTRGGILSVDDVAMPNNEMRCVILMAVHENQFYSGAFNPNVTQIPTCYAFAGEDDDADAMTPHEESAEPQAASCTECPLNEMGSADTGRGKACKNIRRLALVTEDAMDSAEAFEEAEVRTLKVPVTSVKLLAKHINRLSEEMERPTWGVVTLIKVVPDAKSQFKVQFTFESLVNFDQPLYDAMQRKRGELSKEMVAPYQAPSEEAPPAKPARRTIPINKAPLKGKGITKPAPARTAGKRKF